MCVNAYQLYMVLLFISSYHAKTSDGTKSPRDFHIIATNGRFLVDPPMKCILITTDNTIINYTAEFEGLIFGLVSYDCEGHKGQVLSQKGCVTCGFYCPENDLIKGCEHHAVPISIGIIIGTLISIILGILVKTVYAKVKMLISDARLKKERVRKQRYREEILYMARKEALRLCPDINETAKEDTQGYMIPKCSNLSVKNLTMAGLAMSGGLTAYACDKTLYMNSDGKMCDGIGCVDISTYSFSLAVGSTICFTTLDQEVVKFYFEKTEMIYKYEFQYSTSDFVTMSESYSQCKQAQQCYANSCYSGAKSEIFESKGLVEGFTCMHEGLGCDFTCWHKYSCTWIHWWLVPQGYQAKVYKKDYAVWSGTLVMEKNNIKTKVTLNANNPTTLFKVTSDNLRMDLPISIDSVVHDTLYIDNYLIVDQNMTIALDASPLNFPQANRIGDFQIDFYGIKHKYPIDSIRCAVDGCKAGCASPVPALRVLRNTSHPTALTTYQQDLFSVKAKRPLFLTAKVSVGNFRFKSLHVERANCEIDIINSYACLGCSQSPYIVLRAKNIVTPGIMPIETNCTFKQPYISCNDEFYPLELTDSSQCCYLYVRHLNMSKSFCLKYDFIGNLTMQSIQYSKNVDLSYIISSISSNPNFISGIYSSIVTMTGITIGVGLISKIINRLIVLRGAKVIENKV